MLVLSRKSGEKIQIGDNISLTIVRIGPNSVRIGIEAPREMSILREELQPSQAGSAEYQEMTLTSKAS